MLNKSVNLLEHTFLYISKNYRLCFVTYFDVWSEILFPFYRTRLCPKKIFRKMSGIN